MGVLTSSSEKAAQTSVARFVGADHAGAAYPVGRTQSQSRLQMTGRNGRPMRLQNACMAPLLTAPPPSVSQPPRTMQFRAGAPPPRHHRNHRHHQALRGRSPEETTAARRMPPTMQRAAKSKQFQTHALIRSHIMTATHAPQVGVRPSSHSTQFIMSRLLTEVTPWLEPPLTAAETSVAPLASTAPPPLIVPFRHPSAALTSIAAPCRLHAALAASTWMHACMQHRDSSGTSCRLV